ncbi:MAG: TetR/AcrR family transcriptional regulator [Chloroflexi bacterium]|nr:TetR/AcrR family transcriptional regulator [Chloroflexota bacterium]MCI0579347.1 TetR/AcrR family transcriptional regulator [Chloroflexota bacterium]MCI0646020.1 TetR/AcrR family transcriptional regulator [Chloroflexota bacterium]MCI0727442.1 TetR/AcrR family transcriptional regulator [Chloroflexota bacterium]
MAQDDPFQAQLIAARRNQILEAAIQVFAEKGFHQATIKDVAQAAGVADGTIYNYFDNKKALLLGILDRLNETPEREEQFAEAAQVGLEEWTRRYIRQRFAALEPGGFQIFQALLPEILVNEALRDQYNQQIIQPTYEVAERYFETWIGQSDARPKDVALTLRIIAGIFLGVQILRVMGDPQLIAQWDRVPDLMAELILHGIAQGGNDE